MQKIYKRLIKIDIYDKSLYLVIAKDVTHLNEWIDKTSNTEGPMYLGCLFSGCDCGCGENTMLCIEQRSSMNTIVHETMHYVTTLAEVIGVNIDDHTTEQWAYLQGWLVEQIEDHIKKAKVYYKPKKKKKVVKDA